MTIKYGGVIGIMEIWGYVIVGIFTILGAIFGGIVPHILQRKSMSKEREWKLADEYRQSRREIVSSRLTKVAEIVGLMDKVLDHEIKNQVLSVPGVVNLGDIESAKLRIADMSSDAWTAVVLTGSERLKKSYSTISNMYQNLIEVNEVPQKEEEWEKLTRAVVNVMKIVDHLRASAG